MSTAIHSSMPPAGPATPLASQRLYEHPLKQRALDHSQTESVRARQTFQDFAAGIFFSQMLKAMRSGQNKPAYFHGGKAEEMFQSQMDQFVTESLARDHGTAFADPLFERYQLRFRNSPELSTPANQSAETTATPSQINLSV